LCADGKKGGFEVQYQDGGSHGLASDLNLLKAETFLEIQVGNEGLKQDGLGEGGFFLCV
jgi:hypothetical protein